MRACVKGFITGCVFVCLAAAGGYGQQKTDASDTSLGNIAREVRAQKSKEPKPAKVFTNDNLPTLAGESSGFGKSAPKKSPEGNPDSTEKPPQGHGEKYYRESLSTLQGQLDTHKRELDVLQQKLSQNQTQYYPDPNKSLMQQYSRSDINKLTDEINAKKQQIAGDEKAIEDLREQLRHEGGDSAWLR
jgi:parvulin-like peptidyl-prolyl isomerase